MGGGVVGKEGEGGRGGGSSVRTKIQEPRDRHYPRSKIQDPRLIQDPWSMI